MKLSTHSLGASVLDHLDTQIARTTTRLIEAQEAHAALASDPFYSAKAWSPANRTHVRTIQGLHRRLDNLNRLWRHARAEQYWDDVETSDQLRS